MVVGIWGVRRRRALRRAIERNDEPPPRAGETDE
jgi:hypothetical protein